MNFTIVNLGCKVNRVESDGAAALLLGCGMREVALEDADLVVVNTCAVTGEAEKKTRKAVHQALRRNETARVLVTGCAAALHAPVFESMSPRVEVVAKAELDERLAAEAASRGELASDAAAAHDAGARTPDDDAQSAYREGALLRLGSGFPTRVGVKVQDGCNNACTYCIVHVARGRAWSRPARQIVDECAAYAQAGVKEIVLSGINLGSYRRPEDAGEGRLSDLLADLLRATEGAHGAGDPACRFRISSIEPCDVDDALVDVLAASGGRVCRHLHLPLQSGSSRVLAEMARPYDAPRFLSLVSRLRGAVPGLSLSTDIIVGFPGETDRDFQDTLDVASQCGFSRIHVFPYSPREGTPAAERDDQVPAEVKSARAAQLRDLAAQLRAADYARRVGTRELAVVERDGVGMTESYFEVPVDPSIPVGALVPVTLPERP